MPKKEVSKDARRRENIVRLIETDMDGNKPLRAAIRSIKGIGFSLGNAISDICGFGDKKVADLTEAEQKRLEEIVLNPEKTGIPSWLLNRRRDPDKGQDRHISVSGLELTQKMDINRLKKIRCYKGVRHAAGLPVRGQRTRSSFRKGKVVGVSKKKARPGVAPKSKESGKKK